jgi:hydroxymethylglutaryl-CoA reductase (NADPH)
VKFLHDANKLTDESQRVAARQKGVATFLGSKTEDFSRVFSHCFSEKELTALGQKNCQNLVGAVSVPLGVAGPVPVKMTELKSAKEEQILDKEVLIPLATTEGALIASIQRGCKAISAIGHSVVTVEQKGMTRAPVFRCKDAESAADFLTWILDQTAVFKKTAQEISQHLVFLNAQGWIEDRLVFIRCRYNTDQAMGMNMVTFAVQKAWDQLSQKKEVEKYGAELLALSGNMCADKKPAQINVLLGRGWWVQAEVFLTDEVLQKVLHVDAQRLVDVHHAKNVVGSRLAGSFASNMHIANAAAAFYIATGQDVAHVVDVSQGMTTMRLDEGGVTATVTLPTVPLGVVGGGTWLPAQSEARQMILKNGQPTAAQLAGVLGVAALAGEISGLAALATHDLARAHRSLGREQS